MRINPRHLAQGTTFKFFLKSGTTDFAAFMEDLEKTKEYAITMHGEVMDDALKQYAHVSDNTMSVTLTLFDEDDAAHFKLTHYGA